MGKRKKTNGIFVTPCRKEGGPSLLDPRVTLDGKPAIRLKAISGNDEKPINIWLSSKWGSSKKITNGLPPGTCSLFDYNGNELQKDGQCANCGAKTYKLYDSETGKHFRICSNNGCDWHCSSDGALPDGIITP